MRPWSGHCLTKISLCLLDWGTCILKSFPCPIPSAMTSEVFRTFPFFTAAHSCFNTGNTARQTSFITYQIGWGLQEWFCFVSLKEAKKAPKGEVEAKSAPRSVTTRLLESCQKPVDDNSQNQFNLGWFSLWQNFVTRRICYEEKQQESAGLWLTLKSPVTGGSLASPLLGLSRLLHQLLHLLHLDLLLDLT